MCERIRCCCWLPPFLLLGPLVSLGRSAGAVVAVLVGRLALSFLWRCPVVSSSSSVFSGVASSLVRSFAVPGAAAAALLPPAFACPLVSGSGVPALLRVGSRVVPSSSFLPVGSGVVSSLSWDARRLAVVAVVGGRSLVCLASGLGGVGSSAAVALVAALRVARASGAVVDVWGAPGSSGRVCPGYFCGVSR